MKDTKINDRSRSYFTAIPNCVDDMNLSAHAVRLYLHLKRVAGDDGLCWQSIDTLARHCKMSRHTVIRAKRELAEAGLIAIFPKEGKHGGKGYHEIAIRDIWLENYFSYDEPECETDAMQSANQTPCKVQNRHFAKCKIDTVRRTHEEEPIKKNTLENFSNFSSDDDTSREGQKENGSSASEKKASKTAAKDPPDCENFHIYPDDIAEKKLPPPPGMQRWSKAIQPFAEVFEQEFGRSAADGSEYSYWSREFFRIKKLGALPEDIRKAFRMCNSQRLTVSSPKSIWWALSDIVRTRNKRPKETVIEVNPWTR